MFDLLVDRICIVGPKIRKNRIFDRLQTLRISATAKNSHISSVRTFFTVPVHPVETQWNLARKSYVECEWRVCVSSTDALVINIVIIMQLLMLISDSGKHQNVLTLSMMIRPSGHATLTIDTLNPKSCQFCPLGPGTTCTIWHEMKICYFQNILFKSCHQI